MTGYTGSKGKKRNNKACVNPYDKKDKLSIKDLIKNNPSHPLLVIPRGNDCGVGHAVCMIDDLIFDATQEKALKLSKESFDWVCGKGGFDGIYVAIKFDSGWKTSPLKRKAKTNH